MKNEGQGSIRIWQKFWQCAEKSMQTNIYKQKSIYFINVFDNNYFSFFKINICLHGFFDSVSKLLKQPDSLTRESI